MPYVEVVLTIGSDAALLALPAVPTRILFLVGHGHNGTEQTINSAQFTDTLDRAIRAGWPVLSTNAAGNGWGNLASINAYVAAWTWAKSNLSTRRTILYGQSMGALILANVLHRGLITDQICFVSIDGALNLATAHSSGTYQAAVRTAYGIAGDGSDYAAKTSGHDAVLLSPAGFSGMRILLSASTGDAQITKAAHSDTFATNIGTNPAELVRLTGSGAHVTAGNYFPTEVREFISGTLVSQVLGRKVNQVVIGGVPRLVSDVSTG